MATSVHPDLLKTEQELRDEEEANRPKTEEELLTEHIRHNVIGKDGTFKGPFGRKQIFHCDWSRNGHAVKFIEEYITNEVIPMLASESATLTVTELQTSMYTDEVRLEF